MVITSPCLLLLERKPCRISNEVLRRKEAKVEGLAPADRVNFVKKWKEDQGKKLLQQLGSKDDDIQFLNWVSLHRPLSQPLSVIFRKCSSQMRAIYTLGRIHCFRVMVLQLMLLHHMLPLLLFWVAKTRALGVSSGTMLLSYIHTWIQLT